MHNLWYDNDLSANYTTWDKSVQQGVAGRFICTQSSSSSVTETGKIVDLKR